MLPKIKIIIFLLITLIVYRGWLLNFQPNLGPDISYGFFPIIKSFPLPWTWMNTLGGEGLGSYTTGTLWTYPVQTLFQLMLKYNIPFWLQMKYFALLPMLIVSYWGFFKLSKLYLLDWPLSAFFYITNTYFLIIVDGGQLNLALAYSLIPICVYFFNKSIQDGIAGKLRFALSVFLMGCFDFRIIWILLLIVCIYSVNYLFDYGKSLRERLATFKSCSLTVLILVAVVTLLNLFWIAPSLFSKAVSLPQGYGNPSQVRILSFSTITHSLYLQQPHWYKNVFGNIANPNWVFVVFPLSAFVVFLFKKFAGKYILFALIALVGIFFAKGNQPPFGEIYSWLFIYFPGFKLFRDPSKFYILTAFAYAFLVGAFAGAKEINSRLRYIYSLVFVIATLAIIFPVYLGKMTGTFSPIQHKSVYEKVDAIVKSDDTFSRILWIPVKPPLGYVSTNKPSVEAFQLSAKRPFSSAAIGTYELFNYLRAPYMGELFDVAGIKYIVYPYPDTRRVELKPDNIDYYYWFLRQMSNFSWTTPVATNSAVPLIKTNRSQDHFFLAENSWFVVGSDKIYGDLIKIPDFKLANNAVFFVEENLGLAEKIKQFSGSKYILYNKSFDDLTLSLLDNNNFIFPAKNLSSSPDKTGWWRRGSLDLISWRNFLQEKYGIDNQDFDYGGGWAVAEGERQLSINNSKFSIERTLWVRMMRSTKGGKVEFYQGNSLIGYVDTKLATAEKVQVGEKYYDSADFSWVKIGSLVSNEPLVIKTSGEINVVNALVAVSDTEFNHAQRLASSYENTNRVIYFDKLTDIQKKNLFTPLSNQTKISYETVSPIEYKVKISGLTNSQTLIFSESFDELWTANDQGSVLAYSFLNAFPIEKDGEYRIYFTPQKYVLPGLVVSGMTLLVLICALVFTRTRRENHPSGGVAPAAHPRGV